jgi:hypothetical protein
MKQCRLIVLILGAILVTGCSRPAGDASPATSDTTSSSSSSDDDDDENQEGPVIADPGFFIYQAPSGWKLLKSSNGYPQAAGPETNQFIPDITFTTEGYQRVEDFVKTYKPVLVDTDAPFAMKLLDEKPFETDQGVSGVRLHSIDTLNPPTAEQIAYVFRNPNGLLVQFACACSPADMAHYEQIFDATMKSVKLMKLGY